MSHGNGISKGKQLLLFGDLEGTMAFVIRGKW